MEQAEVSRALADVELIKGIMQRTSVSLAGFSRVLLCWGSAWLIIVLLLTVVSPPLCAISPKVAHSVDNRTLLTAGGLVLAALSLLVIGIALGLSYYRQAMREQAISALTRGLVLIWGVVLLISFVFPLLFALLLGLLHFEHLAPQILQQNIGAASSTATTQIFTDAGLFTPFAHAMEIWLFALALFATRAITRLSFPGMLGTIFLLIGLCYPALGAHFGDYFHPGPYALLILGAYLEVRRRKERA